MGLKKDLVFVLKHKKFSESDKIVTFFGKELGKYTVIAKGAQRPEVKKSGNLETGSFVKISFAEARSLDILIEAEAEAISEWTKSQRKHILFIANLVDSYTIDEDPNRKIFARLRSTTKALSTQQNSFFLSNEFHLFLMKEMGYLPDMHACSQTNQPLSESKKVYLSETGFVGENATKIDPKWPGINQKYLVALDNHKNLEHKTTEKIEKNLYKILNYLTERNVDKKLISKKLLT